MFASLLSLPLPFISVFFLSLSDLFLPSLSQHLSFPPSLIDVALAYTFLFSFSFVLITLLLSSFFSVYLDSIIFPFKHFHSLAILFFLISFSFPISRVSCPFISLVLLPFPCFYVSYHPIPFFYLNLCFFASCFNLSILLALIPSPFIFPFLFVLIPSLAFHFPSYHLCLLNKLSLSFFLPFICLSVSSIFLSLILCVRFP